MEEHFNPIHQSYEGYKNHFQYVKVKKENSSVIVLNQQPNIVGTLHSMQS
jgi:hypothetical protein